MNTKHTHTITRIRTCKMNKENHRKSEWKRRRRKKIGITLKCISISFFEYNFNSFRNGKNIYRYVLAQSKQKTPTSIQAIFHYKY